jgi:squalene cyclase
MAYLRDSQKEDGYWISYWWCEREYATAHAVRALAMHNDSGDFQRIKRALDWTSGKISVEGSVQNSDFPGGSPFATALALQTLAAPTIMKTGNQKNISKNCANWLLGQQQPDGSWQSSARLRIPPPGEQYPDRIQKWNYHTLGGGSMRKDQNRLFSTATVLNALNQYTQTGL